jgi:phosphatidylserine decarboxylase
MTTAPPSHINRLLTPAELTSRWRDQITLATLSTWRSRKQGPLYIKIGGRVLYPLTAVEEYERKRTMAVR